MDKEKLLLEIDDKYWERIDWPFRLLGPIHTCACFLVEELAILTVSKRGLITLENMRPLLQQVSRILREKGPRNHKILEPILADSLLNEKTAKWAGENDFAALHRHGIIAMWSAVEVTTEDIFIDVLCNDLTAFDRLRKIGVAFPRKLSQPLTELDARRVFRFAESHFRKSFSSSNSICEMFGCLHIYLTVSPDVLTFIDEINAVRNCILHRGGLINDQDIKAAPSLAHMRGERFVITERYHKKVYDTLSAFTNALGKSVVAYIESVPTND